jgi:hypothetical protein
VDSLDRKVRREVEQYGWHVLNVIPEGEHAPHSYSIGLFATFKHPEIVIIGLPADTAHRFINNIAEEIKDGGTFAADSRHDHLMEGYDVAFVRVEDAAYPEYFGRAIEYYGGVAFPVLQMVWPDRNGQFPWQPKCEPAIRNLQPVIGKKPASRR